MAMLNHSAAVRDFDQLICRIQCATSISTELVSDLIDETQATAIRLIDAQRLLVLQRWVRDGAWTDAFVLLIEIKLPQWKLRQVVLDDGQWHCSLSKRPNLPLELDETADFTHDVLPLAILGALVEALALTRSRTKPRLAKVISLPHRTRAKADADERGVYAVSCEDFC
jgi:hypothetical protein